MAPKGHDDLPSALGKLSINTTKLETAPPPRTKAQKKKSSPVADSWEDEAEDDEDDDAETTPVATSTRHAGTSAPPPTPLSPVEHSKRSFPNPAPALSGTRFSIPPFDDAGDYPSPSSSSTAAGGGPSKRPEKTDAVARRMIASALGMRAPKPTEEQRAYDKAVREKERKRREEEKERERKREEEIAKTRQAIWDD
ncbi:hypothetical protein N658DRAFT_85200 [Parathielavia hyrcaniae]|uniref:Uncharacterized protein n=1 Tax=Parathielavia hyrcaniae TaxID=113614 RepID=A0AAN6T0R4_9PEZI|nr:hypothetical protein N658DRAFT_85200 [Parathielavia hyrcaniae]